MHVCNRNHLGAQVATVVAAAKAATVAIVLAGVIAFSETIFETKKALFRNYVRNCGFTKLFSDAVFQNHLVETVIFETVASWRAGAPGWKSQDLP